MKPKQLALIVVLALAIGGLGLWISRRDAASYQTSGVGVGSRLLPEFPLNEIARITVQDETNALHLVRENETWKVQERHQYPANFTEVGDFLRKVWDMDVVQAENISESQLPRLELLEPGKGTNSGTLVDFQDASGKTVAALILGKKHMRQGDPSSPFGAEGFPNGRWIRVVGRPEQAALVSESFTEIEPKPDRWLNKDFFKVEKIRRVEVIHPEATNSWTLYREGEGTELKLANPETDEKLDTGKASPAGNLLSWPSFVDVVDPAAAPEQTGMDHPIVAKVDTFEGFHYTVKVGAKTADDNYHLRIEVAADFPKDRAAAADEKPEDKERLDKEFKEKTSRLEEKLKNEKSYEPWTYLVSKWTIDTLLKKRGELMQDPAKDAGKTETEAATELPTSSLGPVGAEDEAEAEEP